VTRRPYVLTKGAADDLRGISRYTAETWGEAQRRAYVQQLQEAASEVAEGRSVFRDWGAVLPGLRVKATGSHYIFCLSRPGRPALILAILHERMDLITRLKRRLDDRKD
jgi:plasmid stabilization system protein ParE